MRAIDYLPLQNGCTADALRYQASAKYPACNIASSEISGNNAWSASLSGLASANKNNSYRVRAVAALSEEVKEEWIKAYFDCAANKKRSCECNAYRAGDWEHDLWRLIDEVYSRTYSPSTSSCFVVEWPTVREIFAANFRDRIVQHWVVARLMPIIEERFRELGNVSHSCRKGFGTAAAVRALRSDILDVSKGYTREAWICKIDVQSFFMSIDVDTLWRLLRAFILDRYKGADIETLLYLSEVVVKHRPQGDSRKLGDISLWDKLPKHKSLFGVADGKGMPIGNITSQILANFYMSYYVAEVLPWVRSRGGRLEGYVDDWAAVFPHKKDCLEFRDRSRRILRDVLDMELHPNKFYCQDVRKGVKFVGTVIKPHRSYTNNRTIHSLKAALQRLEVCCKRIARSQPSARELKELAREANRVNCYLGFTRHTASFRLRQKLFRECCDAFYSVCYTKAFAVVHIKRKYDYKQLITQNFLKHESHWHLPEGLLPPQACRNTDGMQRNPAHRELQHH